MDILFSQLKLLYFSISHTFSLLFTVWQTLNVSLGPRPIGKFKTIPSAALMASTPTARSPAAATAIKRYALDLPFAPSALVFGLIFEPKKSQSLSTPRLAFHSCSLPHSAPLFAFLELCLAHFDWS